MNYVNFNKKEFCFKKINGSYFKRFDKSEMQNSMFNNHSIFKIHNSINNMNYFNKKIMIEIAKNFYLIIKILKKKI